MWSTCPYRNPEKLIFSNNAKEGIYSLGEQALNKIQELQLEYKMHTKQARATAGPDLLLMLA